MTPADKLRSALADLKLGQREAARILGIEERTMRRYCADQLDIPPAVFLALDALKSKRAADEHTRLSQEAGYD